MKFARVLDGVVVEVWDTEPEFHPDIMASIHEAPDEVQSSWTFDGTTFLPPPPPQPSPEQLADRFDPSPNNLGFTGTMLDMIEGGL